VQDEGDDERAAVPPGELADVGADLSAVRDREGGVHVRTSSSRSTSAR
jgi:hypothetical protein